MYGGRTWIYVLAGLAVLIAFGVGFASGGEWLGGSDSSTPSAQQPPPASQPSFLSEEARPEEAGEDEEEGEGEEEDTDDDDEEEEEDEDGDNADDGGRDEDGEGGHDGHEGAAATTRRPRGAFIPSVRTAPATIWAVGDGADGGSPAKSIAQLIRAGRPDRFLYLGDVYDWDNAAEFSDRYGSVYRRLNRVTAPTTGNHDTPTSKGYDPYWKRVRGKSPPSYYSFRAGGWTILSIGSEAAHDSGSAQVRWLRSKLRRPGTCRLAFWHRPRYSAGKHGDQDDMAPIWNALRGRASIVVTGHDHDMQRLKPIDGITSFVSGAGGKSHYDVDRDDSRLAFENDTQNGALRLQLTPGRAGFAFVNSAGRTLDSGTVRCR